MRKMLLLTAVIIIAVSAAAIADSLWSDKSVSPYSNQRSYKVGDVVMVLIIESTSAVQKAGTDTSAQDNLSMNFTHTIQQLNPLVAPTTSLSGSKSSAFNGSGSTTRSSNVLAAVGATVTEVMQNGNLVIQGTHKVSVNDESQEISIKGVVRPSDITQWNTVNSYQVADSTVTVKGKGTVGETTSPGLLMKILNWIF